MAISLLEMASISGKYLQETVGRTIQFIYHRSTQYQKHLLHQYEKMTCMVGAEENFLEVINARVNDTDYEYNEKNLNVDKSQEPSLCGDLKIKFAKLELNENLNLKNAVTQKTKKFKFNYRRINKVNCQLYLPKETLIKSSQRVDQIKNKKKIAFDNHTTNVANKAVNVVENEKDKQIQNDYVYNNTIFKHFKDQIRNTNYKLKFYDTVSKKQLVPSFRVNIQKHLTDSHLKNSNDHMHFKMNTDILEAMTNNKITYHFITSLPLMIRYKDKQFDSDITKYFVPYVEWNMLKMSKPHNCTLLNRFLSNQPYWESNIFLQNSTKYRFLSNQSNWESKKFPKNSTKYVKKNYYIPDVTWVTSKKTSYLKQCDLTGFHTSAENIITDLLTTSKHYYNSSRNSLNHLKVQNELMKSNTPHREQANSKMTPEYLKGVIDLYESATIKLEVAMNFSLINQKLTDDLKPTYNWLHNESKKIKGSHIINKSMMDTPLLNIDNKFTKSLQHVRQFQQCSDMKPITTKSDIPQSLLVNSSEDEEKLNNTKYANSGSKETISKLKMLQNEQFEGSLNMAKRKNKEGIKTRINIFEINKKVFDDMEKNIKTIKIIDKVKNKSGGKNPRTNSNNKKKLDAQNGVNLLHKSSFEQKKNKHLYTTCNLELLDENNSHNSENEYNYVTNALLETLCQSNQAMETIESAEKWILISLFHKLHIMMDNKKHTYLDQSTNEAEITNNEHNSSNIWNELPAFLRKHQLSTLPKITLWNADPKQVKLLMFKECRLSMHNTAIMNTPSKKYSKGNRTELKIANPSTFDSISSKYRFETKEVKTKTGENIKITTLILDIDGN